MFKKLHLTLLAALVAVPAFAGKLAVPGSNDPSGTVVIPGGLLEALTGARGAITYTAGAPTIANLVALALRLLNLPGTVDGDPNAAPNTANGRVLVLHGIDIVDRNGNRLTADIVIDRQTNEITITKVGSGSL
jgi:hypothetical protein